MDSTQPHEDRALVDTQPHATHQRAEEQPQKFVKSIMRKTHDIIEKELAASWEKFQQEMSAERNAFKQQMAVERARLEKEIVMERAKLAEERQIIEAEREAWNMEKSYVEQVGRGNNDLVTLNLGGEKLVTVKRSLFRQVEGSYLQIALSGRHDERLDKDAQGNVFFDYSPQILGPLIEYLRLLRDAEPGAEPELPCIQEEWLEQWSAMLRCFDLKNLMDQMDDKLFTFSGIKTQLAISDLHGWNMGSCKPFSHQSTSEDFQAPRGSNADVILVATRKTNSSFLDIAAMGRLDKVTKITDSIRRAEPHNGAFWYFIPGKSIGFAPTENIMLDLTDATNDCNDLRLSWHLDCSIGGFRSGNTLGIDIDMEKVIFWGRLHATKLRD